MKDDINNVEQAENSASKIGKFNTAGDLLAAYNALEGEFTKRCQLIKQLQAELENAVSTQAENKAETAQTTAASPENDSEADVPTEQKRAEGEQASETASAVVVAAQSEMPSATAADEVDADALAAAVVGEIERNAAAYADALCMLPEIMDACVARYKKRLIEARVIGSPSGVAVIAPRSRPRTLADAKALADKLISKS